MHDFLLLTVVKTQNRAKNRVLISTVHFSNRLQINNGILQSSEASKALRLGKAGSERYWNLEGYTKVCRQCWYTARTFLIYRTAAPIWHEFLKLFHAFSFQLDIRLIKTELQESVNARVFFTCRPVIARFTDCGQQMKIWQVCK